MNSTRLKWVLLVDDDGTTNMLNKLFLKKLIPDLEIDTVTDGHRALDFIEANINDIDQGSFLLILDIEMPIMNGWQFLEAFDILFRKEEKEKIVIAVLRINLQGTIQSPRQGMPTEAFVGHQFQKYYPNLFLRLEKIKKLRWLFFRFLI